MDQIIMISEAGMERTWIRNQHHLRKVSVAPLADLLSQVRSHIQSQ
jgi:hypothetical protein